MDGVFFLLRTERTIVVVIDVLSAERDDARIFTSGLI
jgi:hypothetical protein